MFRQMGNAVEVLFVDVPYAGFLSPEPDFKGVTGELLSHWAFEPQMLASYAIHYSSGKPISANNITRLHTSRNYRRAYDILRSAASAYLDMDTHMSAEGLSKGIGGFDKMLKFNALKAPLNRTPSLEDVGKAGLYLASDLSSGVTGQVQFVDCGASSVFASLDEMECVSRSEA